MNLTEHSHITSLVPLIDKFNQDGKGVWIVASIRKDFLKSMTNEAFLMAIRSSLQLAELVHIFWGGERKIYIAWKGEHKKVYKHLRGVVSTALMRAGLSVEASAMISYIDPCAQAEELKLELGVNTKKTSGDQAAVPDPEHDPLGWDDEDDEDGGLGSANNLVISAGERQHYQEIKTQKPYRKQMHVLVVEDQPFSQKLMCEIIRSARPVGQDNLVIDAVQGAGDAWKLFVKKAHDIAFIDLVLADGSGHALAQAIKELDPMTCVVIVTSNNNDEEHTVAQQNNVDGFVAKPYNKKQILDYIEKYSAGLKARAKGTARASTDRSK